MSVASSAKAMYVGRLSPLVDSNVRFHLGRSVRVHLGHIHTKERPVRLEHFHGQTALTEEISLSDLDHAAKFCDAFPLHILSARERLQEKFTLLTVACNSSPEREFRATSTPLPCVSRIRAERKLESLE